MIEELCAFAAFEVKNRCEENSLNEEIVEFDKKDRMIMESLSNNMVKGCCLFEVPIFYDIKKPMQELRNDVKGYAHANVKKMCEEVKNMEAQDQCDDSCGVATFTCTPQIKACFDYLMSNKASSKVKVEDLEKGRRKRGLNEESRMWLPKGVVDLKQILHAKKFNLGSKMFKTLVKKKKSKIKSRSNANEICE